MNKSMAEMIWELIGDDVNEHGLPPGFRFHPTDEELVTFYLASKVFNGGLCGLDIVEVDLNRCEPWELPDVAKLGEREWYFFSLRDRKYPTGLRTNRATGAGYWKATGKDREVHVGSTGALVGMKKTLVFYKGRAPRGEKTKWVLHEYRLEGDFSCRHACKEEWVICRIFNKYSGGGDKKLGPYCYPNPTYFGLDPSTTSSSLLHLQTLEPPIHSFHPHSFLEEASIPLLHLPHPSPSLPAFPNSLKTTHCLPKESLAAALDHEEAFSSWLDGYLHNPVMYDMGLALPFGGGGAVHDLPSLGPMAAAEYGPLVP